MFNKLRRILFMALIGLCVGFAYANPVMVRTYGFGKSPAEALADSKQQAVKEAYEVVFAGHKEVSASKPDTKQITKLRVITSERQASGAYKVEIEAEVSVSPPIQNASKFRAAFAVDSDSSDSELLNRIMEEAKKNVIELSSRLVVVNGDSAQINRLLDKLRGNDLKSSDGLNGDYDFLYILSSVASSVMSEAVTNENLERRYRLTLIDVANREVRSVTSIPVKMPASSRDIRSVSAQDAGRNVAKAVLDQASQAQKAAERVRVISISTGNVALHVGQKVVVFRAAGFETSALGEVLTTGVVISLAESSARIRVDSPLRSNQRYVVEPYFDIKRSGIISDTDW